jgi:hypothetical protein
MILSHWILSRAIRAARAFVNGILSNRVHIFSRVDLSFILDLALFQALLNFTILDLVQIIGLHRES